MLQWTYLVLTEVRVEIRHKWSSGFTWKCSLTAYTLTYQSSQYTSFVLPSLGSGRTGILTCCPSPTLFSLSLGPTNPWLTNIAMETLDIRRPEFSSGLSYSCQHSHFHTLQQLLTGYLHRVAPLTYNTNLRKISFHYRIFCSCSYYKLAGTYGTLPYHANIPKNIDIHCFGRNLSPVGFSAQNLLTSELLRTL